MYLRDRLKEGQTEQNAFSDLAPNGLVTFTYAVFVLSLILFALRRRIQNGLMALVATPSQNRSEET